MLRRDLKPGDRYKVLSPGGLKNCGFIYTVVDGDGDLDEEGTELAIGGLFPSFEVGLVPNDLAGDTLTGSGDQASLGANPKQRFGDLKAPLHLVPPALEIGASVGLGEGGEKYGPYNWRNSKVEYMTYLAALRRHVNQLIDGEDIDTESKWDKHHLEGIAANAAILLDAYYGDFLIDNRPPKGPASKMLATIAANKKKRMEKK